VISGRVRHVRYPQIGGDLAVSGQIRHESQAHADGDDRSYGKAVQPVGEIDRIGRSGNDQNRADHKSPDGQQDRILEIALDERQAEDAVVLLLPATVESLLPSAEDEIAQEEAKRFHSEQLLPEHIVIALLKDGEGVGVKALQKAKLDLAEMQMEIERSLPMGKSGLILGDVPPSKRGKKILEDSAAEARNLGHEVRLDLVAGVGIVQEECQSVFAA
jgi:hypothetical protein